jgi:hypothetical protein
VTTWGALVGTVAASAVLMGAEPVDAQPVPPLPVPPILHQAMLAPFLARITISGDTKMSGVFEHCVDPAAPSKSAQARAKARPAGAPPSLTGCTNTHEMRPDGSIHVGMSCDRAKGATASSGCTSTHEMRPDGSSHGEMSCDRAKGAKASFRMTSEGTPNDLRMHMERHDLDPTTGAPKTTIYDTHLVRLGPCPADLKPGQMRRPGGPVIEPGEAARLLEGARGAAP